MEQDGSSPCSQQLAIGPYTESDESSSYFNTLFILILFSSVHIRYLPFIFLLKYSSPS
jgi:hypothetical protein